MTEPLINTGLRLSHFCNTRLLRLFLPAILFVTVFAAIVSTIDDYGITYDEPYYIENAKTIETWFTKVVSSSSYLNYEVVAAHWKSQLGEDLTGNVHPPFYKLSAIVFRHLLGKILFDNIVFQYRVSTAFWTSILVLNLYFFIRRFTGSSSWGVVGGLSFITAPRFFAESHFFTTDMMISALGFAGLSLFIFGSKPWHRIALGGAVFGAALATKFTGVLALGLVAPLILTVENRKRFVREYLLMAVAAMLFFSLFNFPVILNPLNELAFYLNNYFNRQKLLPISTLYFGTSYPFILPMHFPWVMLGITMPTFVVFSAVAGVGIETYRSFMLKSRESLVVVIPLTLLMTIYMSPFVPKHDGIRLFSSIWPFIILAAVLGLYRLDQRLFPCYRIGMILAIISVVTSLVAIVRLHPYELSYYNELIGGPRGAQEKGFTISYWNEAFNREFFAKLVKEMGSDSRPVFSFPDNDVIQNNQIYGFFPQGIKSVPQEFPFGYILILNRIVPPEILACKEYFPPLIELKTPDGAFIGGMYRVVRKQ